MAAATSQLFTLPDGSWVFHLSTSTSKKFGNFAFKKSDGAIWNEPSKLQTDHPKHCHRCQTHPPPHVPKCPPFQGRGCRFPAVSKRKCVFSPRQDVRFAGSPPANTPRKAGSQNNDQRGFRSYESLDVSSFPHATRTKTPNVFPFHPIPIDAIKNGHIWHICHVNVPIISVALPGSFRTIPLSLLLMLQDSSVDVSKCNLHVPRPAKSTKHGPNFSAKKNCTPQNV